ncbi:SGNH/GDSL hydrolase family protein [Arthrobacter sp. ok362]|uniref:SGNH/GDSL hydrolase family protein n=1 Tax=Arthrobacter sp. ok362 TaxID=1761745 RepID=UPI0008803F53|nr:SGNH/GDSL hydrolase family protein [Arthrobacter sp. ok362]SDL62699.1 Lysophospholipase L1 [Arthrobacter sp. ok362]
MNSMQLLSAYGHSWVDSTGAAEPQKFVAERVARKLGVTVKNCGVGGSLSTETAVLVTQGPVESSTVFLLMTGLNDARMFGPCQEPLRDYAQALDTIFRAFHQANSAGRVVVVQQPHLLDYSRFEPANKGSDAIVDAYNSVLVETAGKWVGVDVADVAGWDPHTMLDGDTVHPNHLGHEYLANAVLDVITARARP